jgi:hypothetical protein
VDEWLKHLEMRLRAMSPDVARRLYRASKAWRPIDTGPLLTEELLSDCKFFATRLTLLDALPKRGIVAELGTYRGDFAREIQARASPEALHLIDIDFTQFSATGLESSNVHRHQGLTHEVIATFPDAHFDWIYIDADHSYQGAARDANASAAKIKPGGFMVFNDFAHLDSNYGRYGVQRAVSEFAVREGWPMSHFAYHQAGLYDVALRRPL